ncbi:flagellin [Phreatobacter cathodiphilus]|uniref:flagellin n=1 Tax=Phreatobacter cathodiphilus TaxID=1868589 RepID=UPI003CCC40E9
MSIAELTSKALGITAETDEAAADLVGGSTGFDASAGDVSFKINGTTVTLEDDGGTNGDGVYSADDIATAINTALGSSSTVSASVDAATGALTLSNSATGSTAEIELTDFTGLTASDLGFTTTSSTGRDAGDTLSVATQDGANAALEALDEAINLVSKARADIGATESRFSFRSESIATSIENLSAANSALEDVDVASESAKLASAKVKTQAAVAAASQASQMPQDLLKLLQ